MRRAGLSFSSRFPSGWHCEHSDSLLIRYSGSALLERKERNAFYVPGGARRHAHIHCAHTCVKLKPSQPHIWLRTPFLLVKHFGCRSIGEDTFSCFDGPRVTEVIATRCIYTHRGWCHRDAGVRVFPYVCVCTWTLAGERVYVYPYSLEARGRFQ